MNYFNNSYGMIDVTDVGLMCRYLLNIRTATMEMIMTLLYGRIYAELKTPSHTLIL